MDATSPAFDMDVFMADIERDTYAYDQDRDQIHLEMVDIILKLSRLIHDADQGHHGSGMFEMLNLYPVEVSIARKISKIDDHFDGLDQAIREIRADRRLRDLRSRDKELDQAG
jgi:hypothetical protein